MGGAKDQPGQLFLQNRNNGGFSLQTIESCICKRCCGSEDVAASVFLTQTMMVTLDLYVASGGFEFNENDPALQDRLYLNDGKGEILPKRKMPCLHMLTSKGCVKAADIDGDGDQDLFVGGRVVARQLPGSPPQLYFTERWQRKFSRMQRRTACAALQQPGMVTDALWMDINNDKQPDLVVVGEWMPVKIYINTERHYCPMHQTVLYPFCQQRAGGTVSA